MLSCFSHVRLFVILWTVAHQAPLSMRFSRQEYWSGLPFSPPGDLASPGIKPHISCVSCIGRWSLYHLCHLENPLISISVSFYIYSYIWYIKILWSIDTTQEIANILKIIQIKCWKSFVPARLCSLLWYLGSTQIKRGE